MFLKNSQDSQENTGARVPFLTSENFKKLFFTEHLRTTASDSISSSKIYSAYRKYILQKFLINCHKSENN